MPTSEKIMDNKVLITHAPNDWYIIISQAKKTCHLNILVVSWQTDAIFSIVWSLTLINSYTGVAKAPVLSRNKCRCFSPALGGCLETVLIPRVTQMVFLHGYSSVSWFLKNFMFASASPWLYLCLLLKHRQKWSGYLLSTVSVSGFFAEIRVEEHGA